LESTYVDNFETSIDNTINSILSQTIPADAARSNKHLCLTGWLYANLSKDGHVINQNE